MGKVPNTIRKSRNREYFAEIQNQLPISRRKRGKSGFGKKIADYITSSGRKVSQTTVNVGKIGSTEIDFVTRKNERTFYYQVTASMTKKSTFDREMAPLKAISDNYPKTVLTLDRFTLGDYDGIEVINAVDWLLEQE